MLQWILYRFDISQTLFAMRLAKDQIEEGPSFQIQLGGKVQKVYFQRSKGLIGRYSLSISDLVIVSTAKKT